jgi:hypothetical protein
VSKELSSPRTGEEREMKRALALAVVLLGSGFGTTLGEGLETDVMREVTGSLVALSTPDVGRAAKWYEEKLGFHLVKAGQMGKGLQFALLRHEDNIVELIQNPQAQPLEKAVPGIKDPFEIHGIFKLGSQCGSSTRCSRN